MVGSTSQGDGRLEELLKVVGQIGAGAIDVMVISPSDISAEEELANHCREPRCPYYGLSANCPPYVSGPSAFRDLLLNSEHVLAVKIDVPTGCLLSDLHDLMKLLHEIVANIEKAAIKLGYINSKGFAVGSCKVIFCQEYDHCSVLKGGKCRYPQYSRPSIEANGVNVNKLNQTTGWSANHKSNNVNFNSTFEAFYGLVLIG